MERQTKKVKQSFPSSEYDMIKTKKHKIFPADSEESEMCFEDMEDFDRDLEELEGDHFVQEKIFKSFVNKMKISWVYNSYDEFAEHHVSVAKNLIEQGIVNEKVVSSSLKVLICHHAELKLNEHFYVILTGMLSKYFYEVNDIVSTFGLFDRLTNTLLIRPIKTLPSSFFDLRFVVISPSNKIKVTNLTAKSDCMRANILRSLFTPPPDFSVPGLKGTIQHSIFERVVLSSSPLNEQQQRMIVFQEMKQKIEDIYSMEINFDQFEKELLASTASIVKWKETYLNSQNPIFEEKKDLNIRIFLTDVAITEKAFLSDIFGLSGIVDAICGCKVERLGSKGEVVSTEQVQIPFELKTGQNVKEEYHAQVLIYNYLMREQSEDYDAGFGFVFYSNKNNQTEFVKLDHNRFYQLMQNRNRIISLTRELKHSFENILQYQLPQRISDKFPCNFCESKAPCVISATLKKTFDSPKQLAARYCSQGHSLKSKDSVKLAFMDTEETVSKSPMEVEKLDKDELDALLEEIEMEHNQQENSKVKLPLLAQMFTIDEPEFKGFAEIFELLDMNRLDYFARWLDMILIEENYKIKTTPTEKNSEYTQYATKLDFDSYDELKIYLRDSKADRDLLLKFSHFFKQEIEASLFLEKLTRGQSITLKHEQMNITLYCVVKGKSIRKKQIFTNEYYLMNLLVQCKKSHINDAFRNCSGKVNYDKITIGWEYYDPVYVFENKMRSNIVRISTDPRYKELSQIIVDNKPPRYSKMVSERQMMEYLNHFELNFNQKDAILKSINTENFNLIMGSFS